MFRLYDGVDFDPLDSDNYAEVLNIVAGQRNDLMFAEKVLKRYNTVTYAIRTCISKISSLSSSFARIIPAFPP